MRSDRLIRLKCWLLREGFKADLTGMNFFRNDESVIISEVGKVYIEQFLINSFNISDNRNEEIVRLMQESGFLIRRQATETGIFCDDGWLLGFVGYDGTLSERIERHLRDMVTAFNAKGIDPLRLPTYLNGERLGTVKDSYVSPYIIHLVLQGSIHEREV